MKKLTLVLIPFLILFGCTPENTGEFFEALSKVPEIMARTVQITVNHDAKTICVAAVIRNIGGQDIHGPFKVAIGIDYVKDGILISMEHDVIVPATVTIPKNGGEIVTDCATTELHYRDLEPGFIYHFEILADYENVIKEFDDWGNNDLKIDWWTNSPKN